jgi:predicted Fe-Mo cluster-binding NifX family protein
MKYAVPVSEGKLSPHFGHTEQFAIFDVDEENKAIIKSEVKTTTEQGCGLLPAWLAGLDVSVVLAGGMGGRPYDVLSQNGIRVILGVRESDPEQAVLSYMAGNLATGDNMCDSNSCQH